MTDKPLLVDLFCCAGGASRGYAEAGFDVVGVDIAKQKNYPYPFIQADAVSFLMGLAGLASVTGGTANVLVMGRRPAAIHASPPCQGYTALRHAPGAKGTAPRMIGHVRGLLKIIGLPYVIENVAEAKTDMLSPVQLCGTSFDLGAYGCQLKRHRLFETNWPLTVPECDHHQDKPTIGVYGGHARIRSKRHGGRGTQDRWLHGHRDAASRAMGIDWMTLSEMSEALPPAYTRFIGAQLLNHIKNTA